MQNNFTSLGSQQFKNKLYSGKYILIDIRTLREQTDYGIISKDQLHIDISNIHAISTINNLQKDNKYLIYCWHGVRSKHVLEHMKEHGFKEVYDLKGGIDKWGE